MWRHMVPLGLLCVLVTAEARADVRTEIGELEGVPFRIDMPEQWNGGLIVYLRAYMPEAPVFRASAPSPILQVFLDQRYAVAVHAGQIRAVLGENRAA